MEVNENRTKPMSATEGHRPQNKGREGEEGWSKLLSLLDSDPRKAEIEFRGIEQRYTEHFRWKGCKDAEWLFGRMIDQIIRRLSRGTIKITDVRAYLYGAAKKTLQNWIEEKTRYKVISDPVVTESLADSRLNPEQELLLKERTLLIRDCFDRCLKKLKPDQLFVFEKYHLIEGDKIAQRSWLCELLKVTRDVLTKRAKRIKDKLQACVAPCLKKNGITLKYHAREAH